MNKINKQGRVALAPTTNVRVGLLIPGVNQTVERDARLVLPSTVESVGARLPVFGSSEEELLYSLVDGLPAASEHLGREGVVAIAFACTSGSCIKGPGYDRDLAKQIARASGCPSFTTSTAILVALSVLAARSIALITPYSKSVTDRETEFLEAAGFRVVSSLALDIAPTARGSVEPETLRAAVRSLDHGGADALFVSCTDLRAMEIAQELENELGKPVVTSNQATFWALLESIGRRNDDGRFGQLFLKSFSPGISVLEGERTNTDLG